MTQLDELDIKIAGSLSLGGVAAHDAGCVRPMPRESSPCPRSSAALF
jgi:hypothetical protein